LPFSAFFSCFCGLAKASPQLQQKSTHGHALISVRIAAPRRGLGVFFSPSRRDRACPVSTHYRVSTNHHQTKKNMAISSLVIVFILLILGLYTKIIKSIIRYILGCLVIYLCCAYETHSGIFSRNDAFMNHGAAILPFACWFFYNILFLSPLLLLLIKQEKRKSYCIALPGACLLGVILAIIIILNEYKAALLIGTILLLSYFPFYGYACYQKYFKRPA
jgi:hypothetical protein